MKTKLILEIETEERIGILPEEGKSEDDYTKEELDKFRIEYSRDLNNAVVKEIEKYFEKDGWFEEQFLDGLEELSCEGFDDFKDYGIKISISKESIPTSVSSNDKRRK
jgi:hypothetical protein